MAGQLAAALIVLALIGAAAVGWPRADSVRGAPIPSIVVPSIDFAIGCRAVGVGARAFSVEPRGVAIAVTRRARSRPPRPSILTQSFSAPGPS